jgi:hypothetical protein
MTCTCHRVGVPGPTIWRKRKAAASEFLQDVDGTTTTTTTTTALTTVARVVLVVLPSAAPVF